MIVGGRTRLTRLLIVNADDYGLAEGISRGILPAHREAIATSTSAIALGPAYPKVANWLAEEDNLGVGAFLKRDLTARNPVAPGVTVLGAALARREDELAAVPHPAQ